GPRVTPFWAPQSAVFVADPTALATPTLLALLLKGGSPVTLIYAGDRMEPAIRHGQRVVVDPVRGGEAPASGAVVLARLGGIPDLLRVEGASGGSCRLTADAEEAAEVDCPRTRFSAWPAFRRGASARASGARAGSGTTCARPSPAAPIPHPIPRTRSAASTTRRPPSTRASRTSRSRSRSSSGAASACRARAASSWPGAGP